MGLNARETHPIFFHHLLQGGAQRRPAVSPSTRAGRRPREWADLWLGPRRRHRHRPGQRDRAARSSRPGLANREFIERATSGFEAYRATVEPYTLERAERETGVPGRRRSASWPTPTRRPTRAMICWTLGHHRAPQRGRQRPRADQPRAADAATSGRWGSGLNPLRGQNNVQGGGDMGALPDRLPGFQHVENDALRARVRRGMGRARSRRSAAGT